MYRTTGQRVFGNEQMHPLLRPGLVGHWIGGGSGNTWFDRSGRGNAGVLTGGPLWTLGEGGKRSALSFDGTDDYVKVSAAPVTTYPLTMTAWVKMNITDFAAGDNVICSVVKTSGLEEFWFGFYKIATVNYLRTVAQSDSGANGREFRATPLFDLEWHHIVAVFINSTTHALYKDGDALLSGAYATAGTGTPTPVGLDTVDIGGFFYNTSNFYGALNGSIDDVRLYNRVLSDAEIVLLASRD